MRAPTTRSCPVEPEFFYYDEWDFRANDYKPRWCRVVQQTLEEGNDDFFEKTLRSTRRW